MIRGVGKDIMEAKTEFIGLDFYRPRDQKYGNLPCDNLRIVQRNSVFRDENKPDTRMSWDFPDIELRLDGHVPSDIQSISLNFHWKDADMFKAAYALNKDNQMVVEVYFGNMSENDRKNRMIRNTVSFRPKISLPKAKNGKYLRLSLDETLPFDAVGSSLITVNKHWGSFWDTSWLESR